MLQLIRELKFGEIHILLLMVSQYARKKSKKRKILIEYRKYRLNNSRSYLHHVVGVEYEPAFLLCRV